MKILKETLLLPAFFLLAMGFIMGGARDTEALSKEMLPGCFSPGILERLITDAEVYMTGSGCERGAASGGCFL